MTKLTDKVITFFGLLLAGLILWLVMDAFFGLVVDIYHFLDQFIWAFFAGVIAFFIAISLVAAMFYITMISISLILAILAVLVEFFKS